VLLGLTGGIGAGKSTALAAFAKLGCPTLSSDAVVHELYATREVREAVVDLFGVEVLAPDGEVERGRVAARAFADPAVLRSLERLMHPLVARRVGEFRAAADAAGAPLCVHEVPLLFEAGLADRYDLVVLVTAPDELRRARDPRRFAARAAHQLSENEKRLLADEVYVNDGTRAELEAWVEALVRRLLAS
jgi:dephospho-CoA kinase